MKKLQWMEIEHVSGISCSEVSHGSHSIRAFSSPDRCSNWQSVVQMRNTGKAIMQSDFQKHGGLKDTLKIMFTVFSHLSM